MHHFVNFKNFADASIELLDPVTLLIGRNGSGKSNVIEGVKLLSELGQGRQLNQISEVGRGSGSTFEIRGGLINCLKNTTNINEQAPLQSKPDSFEIGFTGSYKNGSFKYSICIKIAERYLGISSEKLNWKNKIIFEATATDEPSILSVKYDNFKKGGKKPSKKLTADCTVLSRYSSLETSNNPEAMAVSDLVKIVRGHLQQSFVFDPNPKLMRGYENIGQTQLHSDGSNLSSVLFELHRKANAQERVHTVKSTSVSTDFATASLKRILDNLRQLPEEEFIDFDFETTRHGEVGLGIKYSNGSTLSARQMSDGTLRALAIFTALETVPEGSRLVVEEIDNGIHPSRVKILVDAIWADAEKRKLNILATTHNPATLDHLSSAQIKAVMLCFHDSKTQSSKLIAIPNLPAAESMLELGRLGELMTQQVLERHVRPDFESGRREQGLSWLRQLKNLNEMTT